MLPKEQARIMKVDEFRKWLHKNYLHNEKFMRKLKLITTLESSPETAIELLGIDYYTHPEFHYDSRFVRKVAELDSVLSDFIGRCIKELTKVEEIVF